MPQRGHSVLGYDPKPILGQALLEYRARAYQLSAFQVEGRGFEPRLPLQIRF